MLLHYRSFMTDITERVRAAADRQRLLEASQAQGEELQAQTEELQAQTEELRQQTEEHQRTQEQMQAELARTLLLQDIARAAAGDLDLLTIADATMAALRDRLELKGGDIRLYDRGTLRLVSSFNYAAENVALLRRVEVAGSDMLGARAVRERRVLSHEDDVLTPARRRILARQGIEAARYVYVPVSHRKTVVGLLSLTFEGRRSFSADELSLFDAIAQILGQAIRNARLLEREQETVAFADTLARIDELLHSSLDAEQIIGRALEEGGRALGAETAAVMAHEAGCFIARSIWKWPSEALGTVISEAKDAHGLLALETREPVAIDDTSTDARVHRGNMDDWGIKSVIAVPLFLRGEPYAVAYYDYITQAHHFSGAEIAFAARLGSSLSTALENARLYEEQQRIAATLQQNLMHALPKVAGLDVATASATASDIELVGGDFSDVFVLADGRAVILIGDVAGKGIRAAGLTETVRSTARAFATIDAAPAFILRKTNELLLQQSDIDSAHVTALVCVVDPRTGRVGMGSAGHPPAVHLAASSCDLWEPQFGPPLGAFAADYHTSYINAYAGGLSGALHGRGHRGAPGRRLLRGGAPRPDGVRLAWTQRRRGRHGCHRRRPRLRGEPSRRPAHRRRAPGLTGRYSRRAAGPSSAGTLRTMTNVVPDPSRPRFSSLAVPWPVLVIAGLVVVTLLAFSGAYGFHRDELYFIVAGRHPAFGYPDQPPLTPLLSAAAVAVLGLSPTAVRVLPALAMGLVVVLTALIARDLGGTRRAQVLAAVTAALSGYLAVGHLDSTSTFDFLAWAGILWCSAAEKATTRSASRRPSWRPARCCSTAGWPAGAGACAP